VSEVLNPSSYSFSLFSFPTLLTAVGILLLGLIVLVRERLSLVSASFLLVTIAVAIWLFGFSWVYSSTDARVAEWWSRVAYLGIPFIAPATYQFTVVVLRCYKRYYGLVWLGWALTALFTLLIVRTDAVIGGVYRYWWGFYAKFDWLGLPFIVFFSGLLVMSMCHYWLEYRVARPGIHKRRIKSLMKAFAIGYVGVVDFVPTYGIPLYPFGYLCILGFIVIAARAIWVYHLVDITPAFAARQIIDTMSDALLVLDREGIVKLVNRAATELLGYSKDEIVGRPASVAIDDGLFTGQLSTLLQAGTINNYEMVFDPRQGEMRVLSLSTSVMEQQDEPVAIVCIARDITQRKRAEEAIRESEERYRAVVEQSSEGIYLADISSKRFLDANLAFKTMLGYSADELTGMTLYDVIAHERDNVDEKVERVLQNGHFLVGERQYRRKDGVLIDVEVSANVISDNGKDVLCAVVHDITERKRAEERIKRQVQRLAALRNIDMAISASLDLRVTLTIILDQVCAQLRVDASDVLLLNAPAQTLEYAAGRGFRFDAIARSRVRVGEGHTGRAALERRAVHAGHLSNELDPQRAELLADEEFEAYHAVPLLAKGQVTGVLEVFHRGQLTADDEWVEFLEALAGQAAIAIDSASLFDGLQRSNADLALAYDTTLEGWSKALDLRDHETEGHSQRVTEMTVRLARAMGMSDGELVQVRRGALLHDIGKMGIPDAVLLKAGPLTDDEREVMQRHPVYAHELLSPIAFLKPALDVPYCHHEKWDGSGYPRGLKGEQIPLAARVFAVVDVWDALCSDRPYRKGWPEERVLKHLQSLAGSHFDPGVVDTFLAMDRMPHAGTNTSPRLVLLPRDHGDGETSIHQTRSKV
jgi:PAS domain S-box-containing protein